MWLFLKKLDQETSVFKISPVSFLPSFWANPAFRWKFTRCGDSRRSWGNGAYYSVTYLCVCYSILNCLGETCLREKDKTINSTTIIHFCCMYIFVCRRKQQNTKKWINENRKGRRIGRKRVSTWNRGRKTTILVFKYYYSTWYLYTLILKHQSSIIHFWKQCCNSGKGNQWRMVVPHLPYRVLLGKK